MVERIGVAWSIGGYPVPMEWSDITMSAPGGFGNLGQAVIPRASFPLSEGIFSLVTGTRSDGVPFYVGEVSGPPHVNAGKVYLQVQGLQARIEQQRSRRLYQSRDVTKWVSANSDPHSAANYNKNSADEHYAMSAADGFVLGEIRAEAVTTADRIIGVLFWAGDELVTRVAFSHDQPTGAGSFEIRLYTALGPTGTLNEESFGSSLAGTTQTHVDQTLDDPNTMVAIGIHCTSPTTPARQKKTFIYRLRVNGRAAGDTFTLSDLSADLATHFGWDDLSPTNSTNILPLDWESDWPGGMSEATGKCDCVWLVLPPTSNAQAGLYLGEWGRHSFSLRGADYSDLQPQLRYTHASVTYETAAGIPVEVVAAADPQPYTSSTREVVWPPEGTYTLGDNQYDSEAAEEAAARLVEYWSQPRVAGQIEVSRVWGPDGEQHPWDIDAGDLVDLPEFEHLHDDLPPQRVIEVTKRSDGTSVISVGEATSLEALLGDIKPIPFKHNRGRKAAKRRQRKRRRRRRNKGKWKPDWEPDWKPNR